MTRAIDWTLRHPGVSVSFLLLFTGALRVLMAARGDPLTVAVLLGSGGIAHVMTAALVGALGSLMVMIGAFASFYLGVGFQRRTALTTVVIVMTVATVVMPLIQFVLAAIVGAIMFAYGLRMGRRTKLPEIRSLLDTRTALSKILADAGEDDHPEIQQLTVRLDDKLEAELSAEEAEVASFFRLRNVAFLGGLVTVAVLVFLGSAPMWLPSEAVTVNDDVTVGYVIDADDGWKQVIDDESRTIQLVQSTAIEERYVCRITSDIYLGDSIPATVQSSLRRTPWQLIIRLGVPEHPACPASD